MGSEPAILAEFATSEAIEHAVIALREAGYGRIEAYTPHPMPELEAKLGIPRSRTPRYVLAGGVVGAAFAFLLQYWLNGRNYPLDVGGRPLFSAPALIPITFETAVLFASLTAFAAWLAVSRLPTLDDPLLAVEGFGATIDRFWLAVAVARARKGSADDTETAGEPSSDAQRCADHLREAGALRIVLMPEAHS